MSHEQRADVVVIGLGYIGLPTAAAIATQGRRVVGVDVNTATVESVNRGEVPFVEPDLGVAVSGAVSQGLLSASTRTPRADVYVVAVPTPFTEGFEADLSYIEAATRALAPHLDGGALVILESTSPPGATEQMADWILEERPDLQIAGRGRGKPVVHIAHCPERVLPGRVMIEIVTNDRIVGGLTPECAERAAEFYAIFCQGKVLRTDALTAEMSKLVENSFRDVNIAFANELSRICERMGVDVWELIELANHHPRVDILRPGPGVGGHCIAVDPWFIVAAAPDLARLVRTAREVNDAMPGSVVERVRRAVRDRGARSVSCLGLAFKANIDDLRESPAVEIVERLAHELPQHVALKVVEPHIEHLPLALASTRAALVDMEDGLEADVVVLLVDHDQFAVPGHVRDDAAVIDTRGLWRDRRLSQPPKSAIR